MNEKEMRSPTKFNVYQSVYNMGNIDLFVFYHAYQEKLIEKNHQLEEELQRLEPSPSEGGAVHVVRELSDEVLRLRQLLISSGKAGVHSFVSMSR